MNLLQQSPFLHFLYKPTKSGDSEDQICTVQKSSQFEHVDIHVLNEIEITGFTCFIARGNQTFQSIRRSKWKDERDDRLPRDDFAEQRAEVIHTQGEENIRGELTNVLHGDAITRHTEKLDKRESEGTERDAMITLQTTGNNLFT
jgi:hypothetical protein